MVASRKTRFYSALMLGLVRFFIRLYQCTLSPFLRLLCGPNTGCRFTPSCSAYFLEAVEAHGLLHGSWLGLRRLGRCQPWGGSGYDPIPEPKNLASRIERLGSPLTVRPTRAAWTPSATYDLWIELP